MYDDVFLIYLFLQVLVELRQGIESVAQCAL